MYVALVVDTVYPAVLMKILLYALLDPHDLGLKSQFSRVGSQETINTIAWKRTETINNGDN